MSRPFAGKVAIVTGAASGIGRASARLLAQGGARVFGGDVATGTANEWRAELGGEGFDLGEALGGGAGALVDETLLEQATDTPADRSVGEDVFFDELVEQRHGGKLYALPAAGNPSPRKNQRRGGRGQNAGTRCW